MTADPTKPITVRSLARLKAADEKIAVLTAYDAAFARVLEAAGVEVILVGDSLGMVVQGRDSTLPVTMEQMLYHTACVVRGCSRPLVIADMPFLSDRSLEQTLLNAGLLMQEGARMVKLEGGAVQLAAVEKLTAHGIPVCGHLGLLPQSVHRLGGYRVQGRGEADALRLREEARALEQAGVQMLILECVPAALAGEISADLSIPVIGIGAGPRCDGQVLVLYDVLGLSSRPPRFSRDFLESSGSIAAAAAAYVDAVKNGRFPAEAHCLA